VSTSAVEINLRNRLLTFDRLTGDRLNDILGGTEEGSGTDGKLYRGKVPDNVTGPFAVMRLKNRRRDSENPQAELAELELMFFVRNWANRSTLSDAADAADEAMHNYRSVTAEAGVIAVWGAKRDDMGPWKEPADSDVVQVMCLYTLRLWPANLVQYHDTNV
jgi:hypothetical protein